MKTHLKPALGAPSAPPGPVHYQLPVSVPTNGGAADSHNQAPDNGGTRRAFTTNISRPGTRGTAKVPR